MVKKLADWIFSLFCHPQYYDDIRGDLEELFSRREKISGRKKAEIMYFISVLLLFRPSLMKPLGSNFYVNQQLMIQHYFKTSFRSFIKQRVYFAINVFGLSSAIAAAILLYGFVDYELAFDQHYEKKEQIFRISNYFKIGDRERTGITGSGLLAPTLEEEIPDIVMTGRRHRYGTGVIEYDELKVAQAGIYYADPGLSQILEFRYLQGDPATALMEPNSVVLSQTVATKIFGDQPSIVGQNLKIDQRIMQVTGIFEDATAKSHFSPNALISLSSMETFSWDRVGHVTYILIGEQVSPAAIKKKMDKMVVDRKMNDAEREISVSFDLYPVSKIHLSTDPDQEGRGSRDLVLAFALIAILILVIASINYMNLATARASQRAKEISIRKVVGARRRHIAFQFLVESILIAMFSILIGSMLAETIQSPFNALVGIREGMEIFTFTFGTKLIALGVLVGLLSGSYPSFILSSLQPLKMLKGFSNDMGNKSLRRVLVAFQFAVSIVLLLATFVVHNQLSFIQNKDLGYNKEAVYIMFLGKSDSSGVLKQKLSEYPHILSIAASNVMPATGDSGATFSFRNERGEQSKDIVSMASIDHNYLELMEMEMIAGSKFAPDDESANHSIIVNEALVKKYQWENPLDEQIVLESEEGNTYFQVDGVVKDFNMMSLYDPVKPFAFFKLPQFNWGNQFLFVKVNTRQMTETLAFMRNTYNDFDGQNLFRGMFLDDHLESIYKKEQHLGQLFIGFSLMTIIIACLGLFGLTSYTLERRIKEISIRRVLGADINDIFRLLSKEFVMIIVISSAIATPIGYSIMADWLSNFSYHVDVSVFSIVMSSFVALGIALLTIGLLILRSNGRNPVEDLKYE